MCSIDTDSRLLMGLCFSSSSLCMGRTQSSESEITALPKFRPSSMSTNASPWSIPFVMCSLILSPSVRKSILRARRRECEDRKTHLISPDLTRPGMTRSNSVVSWFETMKPVAHHLHQHLLLSDG